MNGIIININPVALSIGSLEIRWYSLAIMLAVFAAIWISARRAVKCGLSKDDTYNLSAWVVVAGLIGARLFHVIDRFSFYQENPMNILYLNQGGLAIWGALAGGGAALVLYSRLKHIRLLSLLDAVTPGLLVAQIIGRLGCIVNGDAYGSATSLPWGFIYTNPSAMIPGSLFGVPTHPYPVYEMLWNGAALFIILKLERHFKKDGLVFLTYLAIYSVGRFLLSFVRNENVFFGLQQAQIIALALLVISLFGLFLAARPARKTTGVNQP